MSAISALACQRQCSRCIKCYILHLLVVSHRCVPSQEVEEIATDTVLGNVEDTANPNHIQAIMTQR